MLDFGISVVVIGVAGALLHAQNASALKRRGSDS